MKIVSCKPPNQTLVCPSPRTIFQVGDGRFLDADDVQPLPVLWHSITQRIVHAAVDPLFTQVMQEAQDAVESIPVSLRHEVLDVLQNEDCRPSFADVNIDRIEN